MKHAYSQIFAKVIEHEGYYANVEGDRGGETYMGIARNIHPTWEGWKLIDEYKRIHGELSRNQKIEGTTIQSLVEKFYFEKYWTANGIHLIENYNLQYIIFDWCVNSGIYGAKNVQRIVGATPDGIIGKKTASLINTFAPEHLFKIIKHARINYYRAIAKKGQNYKFLDGWLNRINSINYI
jgi:lysozyme family protein